MDENNRIGRAVPVAVPEYQLSGNKKYICGDCGEPLGDLDRYIQTDEALIEYLNRMPEERQAARESQMELCEVDSEADMDSFLDDCDECSEDMSFLNE